MRIGATLSLLVTILWALPAGAQGLPGECGDENPSPLLDLLEIIVLPREVLAADAGGAARSRNGCCGARTCCGPSRRAGSE